MANFQVISDYQPSGDQPEAIDALARGVELGLDEQTLLGVTGSGKTFTMANVIARMNRPTLVLAHNKTLAAQLCSEFREFFPENAVEYFISYYDYYQPEAYIAHTDTYIEKDSSVNEEIDRLRHSATSALFERRDVIVVASVSCIYGLGDPIDYQNMVISLRVGQSRPIEEISRRLTEIRYERNDLNFTRNTFRVRGDTLEIYPAYWAGRAIRVEFFGDEVDRISEINAVTGMPERVLNHVAIYPASHYVTTREKMERAIREIYLKQFEILVKEAHPWALMTSYNIVNGHRSSENRDLLTGILREEWGFDGMVTTDWWTLGEHYKEVAAGNDLKMATGFPERLLAAVEKGLLSREDMEKAARNILRLILRID